MKKREVPPCDECEYAHTSVFCVLNKSELDHLSKEKTFSFYKKGQDIFYEGSYPHGLYCIYSGKVKIYKSGVDGKEQIVRLAKRGHIIGYRALLSHEKYHASATALEDTLVCFFPKSVYQNEIVGNKDVASQIMKLISHDLKTAERKTINILQKQARERVSETILILKDFYGFESDQITINTTLNREIIGNMSGTTTETAIRVLSNLNKQNIIRLVGKKIQILDYKALVLAANLSD